MPTTGTPGGSGPRPGVGPGGSSGIRKAAASKEAIAGDREKLGLSSMRPSEMVAGLDAIAKRAARQEQIERQGRQNVAKTQAGQIQHNVALRLDDTGRRWKLYVVLGLVGVVLLVAGLSLLLIYLSNRTTVDQRELSILTQRRLHACRGVVEKSMAPFPPGTPVAPEEFKRRLGDALQKELQGLQRDADASKASRGIVDQPVRTQIKELEGALTLADGWNKPFVFELKDPETMVLKSVGGPAANSGSEGRTAEVPIPRERTSP